MWRTDYWKLINYELDNALRFLCAKLNGDGADHGIKSTSVNHQDAFQQARPQTD